MRQSPKAGGWSADLVKLELVTFAVKSAGASERHRGRCQIDLPMGHCGCSPALSGGGSQIDAAQWKCLLYSRITCQAWTHSLHVPCNGVSASQRHRARNASPPPTLGLVKKNVESRAHALRPRWPSLQARRRRIRPICRPATSVGGSIARQEPSSRLTRA